MSLLLWFSVKQNGLLSISMLNETLDLQFHISMCLIKWLWKLFQKKKNKDGHVEEQIGRTNVEDYYYVSKLHS